MTRPPYDRADSGGNPFLTAVILRTAGPNRTIDASWVIVGWREHGKCRMLASENVDHATLKFAQVPQYFQFRDAAEMRSRGIGMARTLDADITSYVLIEADTYAECLAALLFGYQWKPDTIRAIRNPEGMGRDAAPVRYGAAWTPDDGQGPNSFVLCMHRPDGMELMYCDQPAGHYPGTPHAHTLTWDENDDQAVQPALERKQDLT